MDRYAVIGNPVSHSLSPAIHARFAEQSRQPVEYTALLAPLDAFAATAREFFAGGARGANVTLPFKVEAFQLATLCSERATLAGAANFLAMRDGLLFADNTDGAGLVADLQVNQRVRLEGASVLLLGAGGAARGVIAPLLDAGVERLVIANRTESRAHELAERFRDGRVSGHVLEGPAERFDVVLNATSTSTRGETLAWPEGAVGAGTLAYDMAYGPAARPFLLRARAQGARASDGLGMLVEQAAESFELWRGVRPATKAVLAELRERHPA